MQGRKTIKILATVTILVIICVAITYVKSDNKVVLATTKEFNSKNLQENEHMHIEIDSTGDKVPVPNGYVGSKATGENEIDTGYVIYEGEEEVNDGNIEEAQKTRNQYVWIPVPDASEMYGTDANGKKWGKLYDFTTNTGTNIDSITGAKPLGWSEINGKIKVSNRKEPSIPIGSAIATDIDSKIKKQNLKLETTHEFLIQQEEEFNNMITSIEKYGGFYIGRYETGDSSKEKPAIIKGNTDIGSQTWYTMYKKCKELDKRNNNIETGMIWGCQWDRILIWLIESGNKYKEEITNSTSWGNYKNATFKYFSNDGTLTIKDAENSKIIPTGSSEYTKANNIYDLAGNVYEWTMEEARGFGRAYRGGDMASNGNDSSSSRNEYFYPTVAIDYIGSRTMLYIK